jgi:hypothetical protein
MCDYFADRIFFTREIVEASLHILKKTKFVFTLAQVTS